ncbi:MAG: hypothetical protein PHU06_07395 [Gallionella sp.]|nr:hypothetical protein [Gallionella sp.]MDD4959532.1 hypothetical protein [Gallionella sp.]
MSEIQEGSGLLDRAVTLVKKFDLYLLTLGAAAGSWYTLHDVVKVQSEYLYALVGVPFLFLLLFEVLPSWYKEQQIKKLIELGISGKVTHADYFRLQPYEATDYGIFHRADKMHEKVLNWLLQAKSPWSYLTGLSGSGKSSLLQAFVIPELQRKGYRVLVIRSFHNALQILEQELKKPNIIWKTPPKQKLTLAGCLQEACSYLRKEKLLVVFDQFEEFIVLQNNSPHLLLRELLSELDDEFPRNLHFLVVLRTDYIGKLSDLALPERYEFKQDNLFDVSPFALANARQFLQCSGLNLDQALLEKVLSEAIELEESRGLIRPITLNILGIVLAWFSDGGRLKKVRAGQLIRAYLQEALHEPSGCAPMLIAKLLSDTGTRLHRSEAELEKLTHLSSGLVRGCLIYLSGKGLTREFEKGVWEISHDFIARLLSGLVWRLRLTWWKKLLPKLTYVAIALWLIVLFAYPEYLEFRADSASKTLSKNGAMFTSQNDESSLVIADKDSSWSSKYFPYIRQIGQLQLLKIKDCDIKELPLLGPLSKLHTLEIRRNIDLQKISSFDGLSGLQTLALSDNSALSELPTFHQLKELRKLEIVFNNQLEGIPSLEGLAKLQSLEIRYNNTLVQLPSLDSLAQLELLNVANNKNLKYLPSLRKLERLESLIFGAELLGSFNVEQVKYMRKLKKIIIRNAPGFPIYDDDQEKFKESVIKWRLDSKLPSVEVEFPLSKIRQQE